MRERAIELKVGILVLVALGLLGALVYVLGDFSVGKGYRLAVDFAFSGNVQPGAPVKVSGIKVGKVEDVEYHGGRMDPRTGRRTYVRVRVWLQDRVRDSIRQDAEFFVNTQGVLGEQYVEIQPGSFERPPLAPDAIVRGVDPPRTDLIVARLYEFLDSITRLLKEDKELVVDFLRSGASAVRTVDELLATNKDRIGSLLEDADRLAVEGAALAAALRRGTGDGRELQGALEQVERLAAGLNRELDPLLGRARRALDGVADVTSLAQGAEREKLVRAIDRMAVIGDRVRDLTGDLQRLVADVRHGRGTAGALLVEDTLYQDLKEMVRDLKRNPWKFLWKE